MGPKDVSSIQVCLISNLGGYSHSGVSRKDKVLSISKYSWKSGSAGYSKSLIDLQTVWNVKQLLWTIEGIT
ncbi:hypothetical protein [Methanosarcina horonobensis]|uniref:hypothetical protein n=1 Tax=Methanosarcina horonobensis TaxID=418008 RepID=UPI00130168DC|nr:hypothetical protein [Methanosarcina horonobensis]